MSTEHRPASPAAAAPVISIPGRELDDRTAAARDQTNRAVLIGIGVLISIMACRRSAAAT